MKHEAIEYRPPRAGQGPSAGLKRALELAREELKKNPRAAIRMRYDDHGQPVIVEKRTRPSVDELRARMGATPDQYQPAPKPLRPKKPAEWIAEASRLSKNIDELLKDRKNGRRKP